jgi:hypothetical protein
VIRFNFPKEKPVMKKNSLLVLAAFPICAVILLGVDHWQSVSRGPKMTPERIASKEWFRKERTEGLKSRSRKYSLPTITIW